MNAIKSAWTWLTACWRDSPVGQAPLVLLFAALLSGGWLLFNPPARPDGTLILWTFAGAHAASYEKTAPSWEARHPGEKVLVQNVHGNAINERLRSAIWTQGNVPDLVEIEITKAASFFRGPIDQIGFVDLKPMLQRDGLIERIPANRLATYTHAGRIYGVPHDIHPVLLAYRADLLEPLLKEHGLSIDDLDTWQKFWAFGQQITQRGKRYLMQLDDTNVSSLEVMMVQRGAGFFDAEGQLIMDDELVIDTLCQLIPLVAGDHSGRMAINSGSGKSFYEAIQEGYTLAVVCPDWRTRLIQDNLPGLEGKMKLMRLPAWESGGRRTSCWGGTMLALPKNNRDTDIDLRWDLAKHYYFNPEEAGALFSATNILPPDREAWKLPVFAEPRSYWCGQAVGTTYISVADEVPPVYGSPFLNLAKAKLGEVVASSAAYYDAIAGHEDAALELHIFVTERLAQAASEVRRQMQREPDWQ